MAAKLAEAGYPNMSSAVRPMAITPDERYVYFQVSFFFGIVQYDLRQDRVVAVLGLPLRTAQGLNRTMFLLDSAHHGLAMNPTGTKLCVAGTMSDYVAIVTRKPFELQRTTHVGDTPYWSHSSGDGKYCFVSVAGEDRVPVISYKTGRQVKHRGRARRGGSAPIGARLRWLGGFERWRLVPAPARHGRVLEDLGTRLGVVHR